MHGGLFVVLTDAIEAVGRLFGHSFVSGPGSEVCLEN
jgi:hypothetical protein